MVHSGQVPGGSAASDTGTRFGGVQVGDKVTKGQTICIVEAMKLMNEIEVALPAIPAASLPL